MDLDIEGLELAEPRILHHLQTGDLCYLVLLRQERKSEVKLARLDLDELSESLYVGLPPEWQVQGIVEWVRARALAALDASSTNEVRLRLRLYLPKGAKLLANLGLVARRKVGDSAQGLARQGVEHAALRERPHRHAGGQAKLRPQGAAEAPATERRQGAAEPRVTTRPQAVARPQAEARPPALRTDAQASAPTASQREDVHDFRQQTEALDYAYRKFTNWMLTSTDALTKLAAEQHELNVANLARSRAEINRLLTAIEQLQNGAAKTRHEAEQQAQRQAAEQSYAIETLRELIASVQAVLALGRER